MGIAGDLVRSSLKELIAPKTVIQVPVNANGNDERGKNAAKNVKAEEAIKVISPLF